MLITKRAIFFCLTLASLLSCLTGVALSATYSGGVVFDLQNGFQINVPGDWTRKEMSNQSSYTHLFVSPDQNVAVAVTTFPGAGTTDLKQLLTTFQQSALNGAQQLVEQSSTLNGLSGIVRAYRIQDANGPVITGAFATPGNGNGYVIWSMIPERIYSSRSRESDAVTNTFKLTDKVSPPSVQVIPPPLSTKPAVTTVQQKPAAPASQPLPAVPAAHLKPVPAVSGYHWFTEETSALRWQTPRNWTVEKIGANPTLLPPAGDVLADAGGVKVQNLDRKVAKYKDLSAAVKDMMGFISSQKGTVLNWGPRTINGLNCHVTEFTVELGGDSHHMWFIHVERPALITVIQYDAYGTVFARERFATAMRSHVNLFLDSVREVDPAGSVPAGTTASKTSTPASVPQPSGTPATSREAYLLLQKAAIAKDWKAVVSLMTDNSLLNLCREWRSTIPDADLTEADAKANPAAAALEYLQYGKAKERMSWLARPGTIFNVREENSEMHLVMVNHGPQNDHYYWMKKSNGRWRYDFQ